MVHGIQGFFAERERNARRISLLAAAFALVLLAALMLARISPIEQALNDPKRWGFEGPEQYVRRIQLEASPGSTRSLRDVGAVVERSVERGGSPSPLASRSGHATPPNRLPVAGPGQGIEDLLARSFTRRADVPV